MRVAVQIVNKSTGEVREYETCEFLRYGEVTPSHFAWSEGDYSCDCNRRIFFARAAAEDEDWEQGCSDGQFGVRLTNLMTGLAYYDDMTPIDGA